MKHLLTKTNGSSVYKTQGAAKQAANRFLKANQGDYRQEIVKVDNGFEVTMIELTEVTNNANELLARVQKLEKDNTRLQAENKQGNKALAALKVIAASHETYGITYVYPEWVRPNQPDSDNQLDNASFDEAYIANELAYGLAKEVTQGIDPLETLNALVEGGHTKVQKDEDGYISLNLPHYDTPISELTYVENENDLLTTKMKLYAELQPERLVAVEEPNYDLNHCLAINKMNPSVEEVNHEGIF